MGSTVKLTPVAAARLRKPRLLVFSEGDLLCFIMVLAVRK